MTLFKKIFDTHHAAIDPAMGQPHEGEPYPIEDAVEENSPESVGDRLENLAFAQSLEASTASVGEAPSDDPVSERDEESEQNPGQTDDASGDTMAARAALAQRQILETQASVGQPRPTPEPVEIVTPSPATPDVSHGAPSPVEGRAGRRAGRIKTRLLGFDPNEDLAANDPVSAAKVQMANPEKKFPVGWIAIVKGPGRGHAFALHSGATLVGRGEDQGIRLDFGDSSISRQNHAAIAYDDEQNSFFLGHGGKSNIIRLNDRPVLSTEEVAQGDLIRIGETTLRLVVLCGPDFNWSTGNDHET